MNTLLKRLRRQLHYGDAVMINKALSMLQEFKVKMFSRFRSPEPYNQPNRFPHKYDPEKTVPLGAISSRVRFPRAEALHYKNVATWVPPTPLIMGVRPRFPRISCLRVDQLYAEHASVITLMEACQGKADKKRLSNFRTMLWETWVGLTKDYKYLAKKDGSDDVDDDDENNEHESDDEDSVMDDYSANETKKLMRGVRQQHH
eukprot:1303555-Rhodomonas_salina.1